MRPSFLPVHSSYMEVAQAISSAQREARQAHLDAVLGVGGDHAGGAAPNVPIAPPVARLGS